MSMMPCPACKKRISEDAETCPKCGHPITEADRTVAADKSKKVRVGLFVFVLLFVAGAIISEFTGEHRDPAAKAVKHMLDNPSSANDWKVAPLYDGTAVVVNDLAYYWVRDGKVYFVNGAAAGEARNAKSSPSSVNAQAVEQAIAGTPPTMKAHMGLFAYDFKDRFRAAVEAQNMGIPLKDEGWRYTMGPDTASEFKESGGMISMVHVGGIISKESKGEYGALVLAAMEATTKAPKEQRDAILMDMIHKAKVEQAVDHSVLFDNKILRMRMKELDNQPGSAAVDFYIQPQEGV